MINCLYFEINDMFDEQTSQSKQVSIFVFLCFDEEAKYIIWYLLENQVHASYHKIHNDISVII